jgi:hypothetical protein
VPSCKLCKHNPSRRCAVNFDKKYLVNDVLKAKCQAVIRVEIVERTTNQPIESSELREEMILQMAILDGNTYDAKFEAGMEGDFEPCLLLMNNKVGRNLTSAPTVISIIALRRCTSRTQLERCMIHNSVAASLLLRSLSQKRSQKRTCTLLYYFSPVLYREHQLWLEQQFPTISMASFEYHWSTAGCCYQTCE